MMELPATIVLLAIIVEQITTVLKGGFPKIRGSFAQGVSMVVGILLCLTTRMGVLQELSIPTIFPVVDYVLTGLLLSRGSNFLHDLIQHMGKYRKK